MGFGSQYQQVLPSGLLSLRIVIADEFYYKKTLEERVQVLDTISTNYLCKTIVFENTGYSDKFAVFSDIFRAQTIPNTSQSWCSTSPRSTLRS
jgi:hypothetical protein